MFIGTALAGSSFLLAGCDSSYSQQNPNDEQENNTENGTGDDETENGNQNEENDQSGDGETDSSDDTDLGDGDIDNNEGNGDSDTGNDNETSGNAGTHHDLTIIAQYRTSSSSYKTATTSTSNPSQLFQATWYEQRGVTQPWDGGTTNSGGSRSGAVVRASYFDYTYDKALLTIPRFVEIEDWDPNNYLLSGYSTSSSWSNTSYTSDYSYTKIYRNGTTTSTTMPSGKGSYSTQGTIYLKYRKKVWITYNAWFNYMGSVTVGEYNSSYTSRIDYPVGVAGEFPETCYFPAPDGYTFVGWSTTKNDYAPDYEPGESFSTTFFNNRDDFGLYAVYAPKITIYSYYTSDYNSISGPSSTGGTLKISYTNPLTGSSTSASSIANSSYDVGYNKSVTLTATAKSGYSFRGWYTARPTSSATPVSTSSSYSFTPTTGAPYERYALFVRTQIVNIHNQYTTTYTSFTDGSTGGTTSVTYTNNANKSTTSTVSTSLDINALYNKTVKLTATAKSGYKFMGWYSAEPTSNESSFRVSTSTSYSFTSNTDQTKIYALFAKEFTFTVNFTDYGYTNSTNIRFVQDDIGMDVTVSPGKSYSFTTYCRPTSQRIEFTTTGSGDYYIGNGSVDEDSSVNSYAGYWTTIVDVELDITVRQRYTITYNKNNGSGTLSPTSQYKMYGTNITLGTNNLTRTGYTPNGWNTNASGTGTHYNNGASYSGNGNVTLYAQWTANTYYVKFNGNGSTSGSMSNQKFTYDKAQNLTANAFSKTGYSFAGWATSASGSVVYADKASVKNLTSTNGATVNLYAKWNTVSYTITYNGNGGNSPSKLTYNIESTSTLSSSSRTGYTFNGWKPSASSGNWSGGTTYAGGTSVKGKYGNVTLVAQWTAKQYTLTIKGNGGTPDTQVLSPKLIFDGENYWDISGQLPTKTGYSIVGFFTSASGGEQVYDANGVCINGTYWQDKKYKYDGDLTVYAHWQANLEAKYDTAGGYYYVEIGNMPQTKVTDSNLISQLNSSSTNGATYYINGTTMVSKKVNNVEYCKYGNNWYKVEPIRWRLAYSSSQKSGYGTTTDTFAVLDTIVYAGQYSATEIGLNSGYVTTTLDEFKKNITSTTYLATFSANVESFSPTGTTSKSQSANIFISSADEISSVLNNKTGSAKYSVKFSDLVSDILGNGIKQYYTRNLGSNTSTIKSYTELGMPTQNLCTNLQGVQFTIKVSEYGCV